MNEQAIEATSGSGLAGVLFQQSGDGLLLIDPLTGQILDANPSAQRLTEFSRAELLAMSLRSVVRHEQPWNDWSLTTSGDATEVHEGFLLRTRRLDSWVPVRLSMTPISLDEEEKTLLIRLVDGRADLALQRRVQKAEAELGRVLGSVSECLWSARVSSGNWVYRYLSPAVQRLTGRPAGLFLDLPATWSDVVVSADRPAWQAFRDRLALGQPGSLEYRIRHTDGRQVRVREKVLVVPDEDGLLLHGVLGEPTESAKEALPQPSFGIESFERVLSTISHDFSNLITGILGHGTLARLDPSQANTATSLERIESIANRAAYLCRRLATCAGRSPRHAITSDPAAAIRRAVGEVAATNPNVVVDVLADAVLPALSVDPTALAQAVEELLRNALQAGATHIVVRLGSRPPNLPSFPQVFAYPRMESASHGVHIQVQDDGAGISDAAKRGLGEPFFTTRPGQRGLGVATVLGIARAHRGVLRLHSLAGAGTLAYLSFPPGQSLPPAVPAVSTATADPKSPLVLLVDDEQPILDVASRLLASTGCHVVTARNGLEAIEQYKRHAAEIRLVVLDLNLPRLSGDKVAAELRRCDARLPIVLMSGYHDLDDRPELAELRLSGCLRKPFRFPEVLALLERVLGLPAKR
jgi:two-component system, cell cycle sensor histidine kinase and response regulator CckA